MRRLPRILVLAFALLLVLLACDDTSQPAPRAGDTLRDWPTYHFTNSRSGWVTTAPTGPLTQQWKKPLVGSVYGEPLVIGSTLVVATGQNHVYGLDARTGAQIWDTTLGPPQPRSGLSCGNIDPLGVLSTPAYDARTGSVFVVAETEGGDHTLWSLGVTDGAKRWSRSLDTQPNRDKRAEQQRGALMVVRGRVITMFGGLTGDCQNYVGYVTSAPVSGVGEIHSYAVPTNKGAGMWASAGATLGTNGNIYVSSGNGFLLDGAWDKSDSVTELTPDTLVLKSIFAPRTWRADNIADLDLGSMAPTMVPAVDRVVIAGKRGVVYLLPTHMHASSDIAELAGCRGYGGAARKGTLVIMPCRGPNEMRALRVGASTLSWTWTHSNLYASPIIAGDKVYVANRGTGELFVLRLSDGTTIERHPVGTMPHFPSATVSGDWVFVGSLEGVTAFKGQ